MRGFHSNYSDYFRNCYYDGDCGTTNLIGGSDVWHCKPSRCQLCQFLLQAGNNTVGPDQLANGQNFFQTVMLVQTYLGTLIFPWAKFVEYHSKKLERHNFMKPPTTSQVAVDGNGKMKCVTDISE